MSAVRNRDGRRLDDFADIPDEKYGVGCVLSNGRICFKHLDGARKIKGRQLGLDYERAVIAEAICFALEAARRRAPSPLQGSASHVVVERGIQVEGAVVKADNDLADFWQRDVGFEVGVISDVGRAFLRLWACLPEDQPAM